MFFFCHMFEQMTEFGEGVLTWDFRASLGMIKWLLSFQGSLYDFFVMFNHEKKLGDDLPKQHKSG